MLQWLLMNIAYTQHMQGKRNIHNCKFGFKCTKQLHCTQVSLNCRHYTPLLGQDICPCHSTFFLGRTPTSVLFSWYKVIRLYPCHSVLWRYHLGFTKPLHGHGVTYIVYQHCTLHSVGYKTARPSHAPCVAHT